jgi:hypothetical protein
MGPKSSSGVLNFVRSRSKYLHENAEAIARTIADFALPGGPSNKQCSLARMAASAPSITSRRSGNRAARSWRSCCSLGSAVEVVGVVMVGSFRASADQAARERRSPSTWRVSSARLASRSWTWTARTEW